MVFFILPFGNMIYQKFKPCGELQPFVECYFIWQSEEPVLNFTVESPPNGFCSIVFNCGDDYYLQNKKYEKLSVPKQFIAGQSIYSYQLFFLNNNISMAGIVFKPTGLASLFDLPTYEYTEERIPLGNVFKESFLNPFIEKIQIAEATEKVKLLEEFVLIHYNKNKVQPDYIDNAANLIVEKNGMVNVADIMKDVFMSRRNFERKFFKKVGLSPKYYARIRRMGYLMNEIAGKKKADWSSLFLECEYYDQSHFIKDFIEFTGRTPEQYIKENTELANFVDKPKTQSID